jgi:hypothetical protein
MMKNETRDNTYSMYQVNGIFNAFLNTFLIHSESCFPVHYVTRQHLTNDWTGIRIYCKRNRILYIFSKITAI